MKLASFFAQHADEILRATGEHVWLVFWSMLIATAVGVPLGILVTRRPWLSKPILGGANIAETIPSLALFGFLLPVPWLGDRAERLAMVALALYALLPIIRNTATGNFGRGSRRARSGARHGHDGRANFVEGGAAAFAFHGDCGSARGYGADDRNRDDCRGGWYRRLGRIYFSRAGHGE